MTLILTFIGVIWGAGAGFYIAVKLMIQDLKRYGEEKVADAFWGALHPELKKLKTIVIVVGIILIISTIVTYV